LNFSNSSIGSQSPPIKISNFDLIKVIWPKRIKVKDYKITMKDRPLTSKKLNDILFSQIIKNKQFRCPCKKFEKSFACFTARDWINIAFEVNAPPTVGSNSNCQLHGKNKSFGW
jgi:Tfp pilus assembly ATPase PilU